MRNFRNHKRNRFRSNGDKSYRRNGNMSNFNLDFVNGTEMKRKGPSRNFQNVSKLLQKYNELANEALSNGDKILYENYLQHADHFFRLNEQRTNQNIGDKNNANNKVDFKNNDEKKDSKILELKK